MSSIREQALAAAVAALNTNRPGNVAVFVRSRESAYSVSQLPANDAFPVNEGVRQNEHMPVSDRSVVLRVEHAGVASAGVTSDQAIDPSYVHASHALANNTLGDLATKVTEIPVQEPFRFETLEGYRICVNVRDFEIEFVTRVTDVTQKP